MKFSTIFNTLLVAFSALLIISCDPLEDAYDEIDQIAEENGVDAAITIEYTLVEEDYAAVASIIRKDGTAEDSTKADLVEARNAFSRDIDASTYLPEFVSNNYSQFGKGAAVKITYDFFNGTSEDYDVYLNAQEYELDAADYESVNNEVDEAKFFFPAQPADEYIADILSSEVQEAVDGDIYAVSYMMSSENPEFDYASAGEQILYEEDFDPDISGVSTFNISGDLAWKPGSFGGNTYASASSFSSGNNFANEDWMVTPEIDLTEYSNARVAFNQAAYIVVGKPVTDIVSLQVSTDFTGDVTTATWTDISDVVDQWPTREGSNGYSSTITSMANLSEFDGQKVHLAFVFNFTEAQVADGNSSTWQVYDITVTAPGAGPTLLSKAPVEHVDYYSFGGSSWSKIQDVYTLTADDYDAMGAPGQFNNFSSSAQPGSYIPEFLSAQKSYAQDGDEYLIIYKYYNGSSTQTLAENYSYNAATGRFEGSFLIEKTEQYKNDGTGFVFDPSVIVNMSGTDYQIIVDEVAKTRPDLLNSFETAEDYYGADSFYENFDIRVSSRDAELQPEYAGLSNSEAEDLIQERLIEGLDLFLTIKYADAQPVAGIQVFYTVNYATFDGNDGTGSATFELVGVGEFEYIEE